MMSGTFPKKSWGVEGPIGWSCDDPAFKAQLAKEAEYADKKADELVALLGYKGDPFDLAPYSGIDLKWYMPGADYDKYVEEMLETARKVGREVDLNKMAPEEARAYLAPIFGPILDKYPRICL